MCQQLVNLYTSQCGNLTRIVPAGRAANIGAWTPCALIVPGVRLSIDRVLYCQGEAHAVGNIIPVISVPEVKDGLAGCIFQLNPLTAIVKVAGILAGYVEPYAILSLYL